ncbi:MarR family winged helix-turn-helix transcriptional regulator [Sphingobium sp.]|uniref:MarR family winged helix-turn-helix transcriptional regulator n=1 Tax=Sphingobium sp. TaxID=1912891 RepID=UPI0028BDF0DF|nr:MarR family transcriptional regulator [Sphingobium sp.]
MAADEKLDLSMLEDTLGFLVRTLQVRSFRAFDEAFGDQGLTPARHALLTIVAANPGVRQVRIATILGLHEPNMTKLVKEIEGLELIERTRSTKDARALRLTLTKRGKALMASIEEQSRQVDRQIISTLDDDETELLLRLLRKAVASVY